MRDTILRLFHDYVAVTITSGQTGEETDRDALSGSRSLAGVRVQQSMLALHHALIDGGLLRIEKKGGESDGSPGCQEDEVDDVVVCSFDECIRC